MQHHHKLDTVLYRSLSQTPGVVDPIPNSSYLSSDFDGDVYMVPTYAAKLVELFQEDRYTDNGVEIDWNIETKFYPSQLFLTRPHKFTF